MKYFTDVNAVTSKDWSNTYHGYDSENPEGKLIDYCFVNNKILSVSRKLIDNTVDGMYPSDHFGLLMSITIK